MTFETVIQSIFTSLFLVSVIRISTPIIFPALGSLVSVKAGASNKALEGLMLVGAFTGVMVSAYTGNVWLAVLCGMVVAVLISALLAIFHLYLGTDLFIGSLAVNMMCSGGTTFLMYIITGDKGNTGNLASLSVPNVHIPFIKDIPFIGEVLSGHNVFTYLAFFLTFVIYIFLYRTRYGVSLRAVGENPEAATSLGINVKRVRMTALIISGVLSSLGGMNLSMAYLQMFARDMSAGRGWIGLASVSLGGKKPLGTMLAAVLFGFSDAIANQFGSLDIPAQLVTMIPYATTIIALVVYAIQQRRAILSRMKKFQKENEEQLKGAPEKSE
ncbi:MAG: ABC transporter permease [Pelolinea sp.]|nr:ABC transporter permease [Pelolinea sp.]